MRYAEFRPKITGIIALVAVLALIPILSIAVRAETVESSKITISKFKIISGDQYVELRNNTDQDQDMSGIQLVYYNNFDLSQATSSKLVSLSGVLPAGSYYLINDSTLTLCYQTAVASASLGFSTTSGRIHLMELRQSGNPKNPFEFNMLDFAGWYRGSSEVPPGIIKFPPTSDNQTFALRQWNEEIKQAGQGEWLLPKADESNHCSIQIEQEQTARETDFVFLPSVLPPVRYVTKVVNSGVMNRNVGKMAPIVNEMLPNPDSPQTDAEDEFIELYNPNDTAFDLSGFKLAFGSAKPRKYTFPEGTMLGPKEFKAFTSGDTSISLSNTEAQVWLLDPNEKIVSQSEPYSKAKDGQAWVLNNGTWSWSSQPTPNEMNAMTPGGGSDSKSKTAAAVLGISTNDSGSAGGNSAQLQKQQLQDAAPLHPAVLAGVGLAAVGYALYEYRHDISNRVFQLRRYLRNRRALRQEL